MVLRSYVLRVAVHVLLAVSKLLRAINMSINDSVTSRARQQSSSRMRQQ